MKGYDLEERTFIFAKNTRQFIKVLPKTLGNYQDAKQLIRSSGSVGANYIEANEKLSNKDFLYRIRISKKEAKETIYWLKLLDLEKSPNLEERRTKLINEATQLMKILATILRKVESKS